MKRGGRQSGKEYDEDPKFRQSVFFFAMIFIMVFSLLLLIILFSILVVIKVVECINSYRSKWGLAE